MDTANKFMVGVRGDEIIILKPITGPLTKEQALNLAAHLVALADDDGKFTELLSAVQSA